MNESSSLQADRSRIAIITNDWQSFIRAIIITSIGIISAVCLAVWMDDWIHPKNDDHPEVDVMPFKMVQYGLSLYVSGLIIFRYLYHGVYCIYEMLWGCNVALVLAILGLSCARPFLLALALAIVSADQMCWYIDILSYIITRRCPVGVLKYLTYPENQSIPKRVFASHHLFFMPLCLYLIQSLSPHGVLVALQDGWIFPGSCVITGFLASYCRIWTPFQVEPVHFSGTKEGRPRDLIYLNVNGAFEFWRDIPIDFLHAFNHASPWIYLPFLATVGNLSTNGLAYSILRILLLFVLSLQ